MQEFQEELDQQHDAEEAAKWQRDAERQRQLDKEAEIEEWKAFLNPTHLPSVDSEADINGFISEIAVPENSSNPLSEATSQAEDILELSLIHISEPTRLRRISYAVFCLKKKKK